MQLPLEKKNLTVQEAADALNVRRERVWKLLSDGVLTAVPSKLDGRQKLIPREQVESLLLEEGYRPQRTARRARTRRPEHEPGNAVGAQESRLLEESRPSYEAREEEQRSPKGLIRTPGEVNRGGTRRLPRTVGAADDEAFQASESEAYMHEHRGRERSTAE